jgi:PAS domain S-box-containing protein
MYNYAALLAIILVFSLAFYLIGRNPEERVAGLFSIYLLLSAVGGLAEYYCGNTASSSVADTVIRIGMGAWSFSYAVFLHFAFAFSEKYDLLKRRIVYAILYFPPAIFSYLFVFTNFMTVGVMPKYQGYIPVLKPLAAIYVAQGIFCYILGIYLIVRLSFVSKNIVAIKRGRLFAFAFFLAAIVGLTTGNILPFFFKYWSELPPYNAFWLAIACSITIYAMQKYSLFAISPARAVSAILDTTSGAVIALDYKGRISFVNQSALKLFGSDEAAVINNNLARILDKKDADAILEKLVYAGLSIKNYRTSIKADTGKKEVVITGVALYDKLGTRIGAVIDLQDISELVKVKDQLQGHVSELERMNKFMTGREINMVELKKEVNDLLTQIGKARKYGL